MHNWMTKFVENVLKKNPFSWMLSKMHFFLYEEMKTCELHVQMWGFQLSACTIYSACTILHKVLICGELQ